MLQFQLFQVVILPAGSSQDAKWEPMAFPEDRIAHIRRLKWTKREVMYNPSWVMWMNHHESTLESSQVFIIKFFDAFVFPNRKPKRDFDLQEVFRWASRRQKQCWGSRDVMGRLVFRNITTGDTQNDTSILPLYKFWEFCISSGEV